MTVRPVYEYAKGNEWSPIAGTRSGQSEHDRCRGEIHRTEGRMYNGLDVELAVAREKRRGLLRQFRLCPRAGPYMLNVSTCGSKRRG